MPDVALVEVTHLLRNFINHNAMLAFLRIFSQSAFVLESVTMQDVRRAVEIMSKYADSRLDFVDCCIMAQAERLDITRICTFDRRDFAIYRPTHCETLELLP